MTLFTIIFTSSNIRAPHPLLIIAGCLFVDGLYGATFFATGMYRFVNIFSVKYINKTTRFHCFMQVHIWMHAITLPLVGVVSLALAFDRIYSTFSPIRYINLPKHYTACIFLTSFTLVLPTFVAGGVESFGQQHKTEVTTLCLLSEALTDGVYKALKLIRCSSIIIGMTLYIPTAIKAREVINSSQNTLTISSVDGWRFRQLTITVGLTTLNELVLLAIPDLITVFIPAHVPKWLYVLNLNYSVVNLVNYIVTQKELRKLLIKRVYPGSYSVNKTAPNAFRDVQMVTGAVRSQS